LCRERQVTVIADNPRSFIAASRDLFSTIVIEDWGPSIPGMASLSEDALLTEDSIRACWARLADRGAMAISRRLVLPPSDSLRLFSTALAALRREGQQDPEAHLAVIRSWDSCSIILARDRLVGPALESLRSFARSKAFDLDYYPGMDPGFAGRQDLDVAAVGDDRAFPSHFVKWTRLGDFWKSTGQRIYTLLLTGEIVAGVALLEALVLSAVVIVLTFFLGLRMGFGEKPGREKPGREKPGREKPGNAATHIVVAMSGIGFIAIEMFAIDAFAPLFPSATVALSVALGGLLLFSSLGGLASERMSPGSLRPVLAVNAAASIALIAFSPWILRRSLPLAFFPRAAAALGMMAIPGFLIGMPFAAAIRMLARSARERASAWATNGCASVAVSFASALIAPAVGIRALAWLAAAAYAVAAATLLIDSSRLRSYYRLP